MMVTEWKHLPYYGVKKDEDCDYEYGNMYDNMKEMQLNLTIKKIVLFQMSSEDAGDQEEDADFDKEIIL